MRRRIALILYAALAMGMASRAYGMIRHVFIVQPAVAYEKYDAWYAQVHAQECLRYFGPWLRRYQMFFGKPVPPEATRGHNVVPGRYLELWYDNVEAWKEAAPLAHAYSPPPWGSMNNPDKPTVSVIVPANPTENFLGKEPPGQGPFFRWVVLLKYPAGVPAEEADKWYLTVHTQQAKNLPGLMRYVRYKAIDHSPALSPWVRITELWYKDYESWRKATYEPGFRYTPAPWAKPNQPWFDTVSIFVTEAGDVDLLKDGPRR